MDPKNPTLPNALPAVQIDINQCKGCGLCIESCPPHVLNISIKFNHLGYQYAEYRVSGCTGCEACFYACPEPGAITVVKERKVKVAK